MSLVLASLFLSHVASSSPGLPGPDESGQKPAITFTEHIAPIVFSRCTSCHREGEVAPFPLKSYRDVRKRGRMIASVVEKRFMPPWHPVEGHGYFQDDPSLTKKEIEDIRTWVDSGMEEGDPQKLPALPQFTEGWQLGEPDLILTMEEAFEVPAGGPDIYRNFVIPLELEEDLWVTAIEVRPSSRSVLHHTLFELDSSGRARELDARSETPGFSGMQFRGNSSGGAVGTASSTSLGGWAVGGMPRHLPMGLARKLPAGADLVLSSHFHPSGKPESEQTTIGLYLTDEPPENSVVGLQLPPFFGIAAGLDIPAGEKDFILEDSFTTPVDCLAVTVGGHAHYLCKEMQVTVTYPGEEPESVFYINEWDFDWQNRYQYEQPLELPAGTKVDVSIRYDNSAENPNNQFSPPQRIRWGPQSTDEMGSVTLLLVADEVENTEELQNAIQVSARRSAMRGMAGQRRSLTQGLAERVRGFDKNGDGVIESDEIPRRWKRMTLRLDTNQDGQIDADEIKALEQRR